MSRTATDVILVLSYNLVAPIEADSNRFRSNDAVAEASKRTAEDAMTDLFNPVPCDHLLDGKTRELFLLSAAAAAGCGT